jgi:hypothetical protein
MTWDANVSFKKIMLKPIVHILKKDGQFY